MLKVILGDPKQQLLVAEIPSGVVGYLYGLVHPAFHANGNIAWVEELFVESEQRGGGTGRQLMTGFENWARRTSDAAYVAVATRRAHDFYDSIGYAESATYFKKNLG